MRLLKNSLKVEYLLLSLIILIGFVARVYKLDSPIADWHSWRQADTAAVTRNFIKEGFNPFFPKHDDMSGVAEKPFFNPGRFRFVEFPIYNIAAYPLYLVFGIADKYHRLVSVIFSLGSLVFVYMITKRYMNKATAYLAAFIFALLPYNVFFSRTTLPEPTFLFFALGMFYFVNRWIEEVNPRLYFVALFFTITSFLIKPWAIFFALPFVYTIFKIQNKIFPLKFNYINFFLIGITPFILWRLWILQYPEGIPASGWLMNGDGIRFRPMFWYWLVSERIGREILGVTGAVLFFIGLLSRPIKGNYLLHILALSLFAYFAIFATGNVRHDYYQAIFVPVAAIFTAFGFSKLVTGFSGFVPRFWTIILAMLFLPLSFYFSWVSVKGFYQINNPSIIKAGIAADELLPKDARVVAPYNGDTAFLYQTNRPGFPVTSLPLAELASIYDVSYYVSTAKDAKTKWAMMHFEIVLDDPEFIIINLKKVKGNLFDPKDLEP